MYATRALRMRLSPRMMRPVPKEDQNAHTVSQRLRKLRKIPAELYPLGVVVGFALFAAGYSISRKFIFDKNLRLARQNRQDDHAADHGASHGAEHDAEPAAEHAEGEKN